MIVFKRGSRERHANDSTKPHHSLAWNWSQQVVLYGIVLVLGLVVGFGRQSSQAAVNEVIDWETGNTSQTTGLECPTSSNFSIVTSPVRQGSYAAHFHIDSNSALWNNGWPRCMATNYNSGETVGNDYYYGFSVYIPHDFGSSNIWELHQPYSIYSVSGQCSIAPLVLHYEHWGSYNGLYFRIATGDCSPTMTGYPYQEMEIPLPNLDPVPLGQWMDFVLHIKFEESSTGIVELWDRTGSNPYTLEIERTNIPTTQYCSSCGVHNVSLYTEMGVYTAPLSAGQSVDSYMDGFVRGTSFSDVAPGDSASAPAQSTTATTTTATTTTAATTTAATTTAATTTTVATTAAATTTTAPAATTPPPPPLPTTSTTTTTQTTSAPQGSGNGNGEKDSPLGHSGSSADPNTPPRVLTAVSITPIGNGSVTRYVRLVSTVVAVKGVQSLRVSAVSRKGEHRRIPLLADSTVGSVRITYWRKTIVTGPMSDGHVLLRLRIPRRLLAHNHRYLLRIRAVGSTGIGTTYVPFDRALGHRARRSATTGRRTPGASRLRRQAAKKRANPLSTTLRLMP
jgi:Polysaccharide lyase